MNPTRKSYPSDVTDAEWEFVLPNLTLMRPDAPQRCYDLSEVFNASRYLGATNGHWCMLPR
jgi:transposase